VPLDQTQNIKDLANEYGFELPQIEKGVAISQVCITQEMAAQRLSQCKPTLLGKRKAMR
jgi:hypothetical protein